VRDLVAWEKASAFVSADMAMQIGQELGFFCHLQKANFLVTCYVRWCHEAMLCPLFSTCSEDDVLNSGISLAAWDTRTGRCTLHPLTQLQLQLWQAL